MTPVDTAMPERSDSTYPEASSSEPLVLNEQGIEYGFIGTLQGLKYEYRRDITDRATLEQNFREKFEALNRVRLTDGEFARLLDEIVTPDVFTAAKVFSALVDVIYNLRNALFHGSITPNEQHNEIYEPA